MTLFKQIITDQVEDKVRCQVWDQVSDQVDDKVLVQVWRLVDRQVLGQVTDQVWSLVLYPVERQFPGETR